jgi:hypothetical protein
MKISFRLKELLEEHHDLERGTIKRIAQATTLERHQVAAVLGNKAKYVSMEALAGVCQYLIEHHGIKRAELPGKLFRIEPERFSALVAGRKFVELCIGTWTDNKRPAGVRLRPAKKNAPTGGRFPPRRWVMASDSYLQGNLLHELFALGNENHPEFVEQRLVSAYTEQLPLQKLKQEAERVYRRFRDRVRDRGLICLGSVKSNVVIEAVIAEAFHADPFVSEDGVRRLKDRSCPFFFRYREDDAQPPSCHGGLKLAKSKESARPGIYYEAAGGWKLCPSNEHKDVALIFYVYHVPLGRLEMVMGGFSGRATHCLASSLPGIAGKLWPPSYHGDEQQVGAFLIRFEFADTDAPPDDRRDDGWMYYPSAIEVIPLDEKVLRRKLERKPKQ